MEHQVTAADSARSPHVGLWLLFAILWVFLVVWLSFQVTHAALSNATQFWPYLGLILPLVVGPWVLHRLERVHTRAMKR